MPVVRVEPSGIEFEVEAGESVAEAAWRQGLRWPTRCWGQAECMSCFTRIIDGELQLEPAADDELDAMRLLMAPRVRGPLIRLACQLRVRGTGVVLEKQGLRPAEPGDVNNEDPLASPAMTTTRNE